MSEAEPDLGIGTLERADGRLLVLLFAARGERRTYAVSTAPLIRVRFAPDDIVLDDQGRSLTVADCDEIDGLLLYRCRDEAGNAVDLPEQQLNDRMPLNRPQDKLFARRLDPDTWFALRYQTWLRGAELWRSPVYGLCGPRIEVLPHQLFIASEVAGRHAPRVLLADEVGLGKTIEAGLIMHRLLLTERVRRVLIVVPETLIHQWMVEMLRRFNLAFAVFDAARFDASDAANPFQTEQRVLCGLEFLTSRGAVGRAALDGEWDLLIVDEAHHLVWSEQDTGLAYQLVEALAEQTPGVLLLTATPEQLGRAGHFGRLRLLDPQRFHDYAAFLGEEEAYRPVAELAGRLLAGTALGPDDRAVLERLLGPVGTADHEAIVEQLIDRHGTGRVMFRNTRHAIQGFPQRRLHGYALACPDDYLTRADQPTPEEGLGQQWPAVDPRVAWLQRRVNTLRPDKVLVICAHQATVLDLRDRLLERYALHAAVFHEGMDIVARDRAAAFFADPEEGAQLLICSEIGSEGRNFQFAHHLVLFDLPLLPDLLEQRIGRLDRIGQRATIELHVPYLSGTAGEVLLRWYRDGVGSLENICPAAGGVFEQLRSELIAALGDRSAIDALIEKAATLTAAINRELEHGRDRLLELHSHHPQQAARLVAQVEAHTDPAPLVAYMYQFWDAYGMEYERGAGHSIILRRGSHMLSDQYPGLHMEAASVTFDRADALAHEDRQFLTWEHPIVRGSMEMLTSGELGTAAVTVCQHPDYRTGSLLLEALFVTECVAPPGLELQRYLPPTCIRLLLNASGEDITQRHAHADLQGLCLSRNRKLADTVIKSQGPRIRVLQQAAESIAEGRCTGLVEQSRAQMRRELDAEHARLVALAEINPNVRADEIERIVVRRELLDQQLAAAKVRLDALRVVVMR